MLRFLKYAWRKLSRSQAIMLAGPLQRTFFESVYRLVFISGLSSSDDYLSYTMYSTFTRSIWMLMVGLQIWHMISDELLLDEMIYAANVVCVHVIAIWKLMIMVSNKNVFKKLAMALELPGFDISTQKRKDIVKYWANTHTKYLSVFMAIFVIGMTFWQTFPLIDEVEYNLMVEVKLPYKLAGYPLRYVLSYIVVGITFQCASFMVVMMEVVTQAHLIPLICQFDVLADCFENIFEECTVEFQASFPEMNKDEFVTNNFFVDKYLKRLGDLVAQHQAILAQTMELKTILSAPMLGELASSGFLICCVGYQAIATFKENLVWFAMSLLYLCYHTVSLYLICRWCEEITLQEALGTLGQCSSDGECRTHESTTSSNLTNIIIAISQRIGESAYFSSWESGISQVPGVRATIMLVLARSNKPLVFRAGGTYPLSLAAFTNLVKTSYTALNILLTMDSSKEN